MHQANLASGGSWGQIVYARLLILNAVFSVEPKSWQELGQKPWRAWLAFCAAWAAPATDVGIVPRTPAERLALQQEQTAKPMPTFRDLMDTVQYGPAAQQELACTLVVALWKWADRWHVGESWSVPLLAQQFTRWRDRWPARVQRIIAGQVLGDAGFAPPLFRFRGPKVNETRQNYLTAVRNAATSLLDDLDAQVQAATRITKRKLSTHAQWLAYFQVRGCSYEDIRRRYDRTRGGPQDGKTVELAIKALARLADLRLRPRRHGRTPGVREKLQRHVAAVAHLPNAERAQQRRT